MGAKEQWEKKGKKEQSKNTYYDSKSHIPSPKGPKMKTKDKKDDKKRGKEKAQPSG